MKRRFTLTLLLTQFYVFSLIFCQPIARNYFVSQAGLELYTNWLQFGRNAGYTSYNPDETLIHTSNVTQLKKIWGLGCDDFMADAYEGTPVIYDGKVYALKSYHEGIVCVDARKGIMEWDTSDIETMNSMLVMSEDGMLFYFEGMSGTYLKAMSADSGNILWTTDIGFDFYNDPIITIDHASGLIYLIEESSNNKLYAIDKATGDIEWYISETKDDLIISGDYPLVKNDRIFVTAESASGHFDTRRMVSINPVTQEIDLAYELPDYADFTTDIDHFAICDDMLIAYYDNFSEDYTLLVGYNLSDTGIVWEKELSQDLTGEICCNIDEGIIYVPTNPYLYALDIDDGDEEWTYTAYDAIYTPSVANGIVYFISDNNVYGLNETTGIKVFNYNIGSSGSARNQVAIADGLIYVNGCGGDCGIYALGFNEPPELEAIDNQVTNEDVPLNISGITVTDDYYEQEELYAELTWNNAELIPEDHLFFENGASGYDISISPADDQNGSAEFILYVTDGTFVVSDTFNVTVFPVNDSPYISEIPDQETYINVALRYLSFVASDVETDVEELTVTASSNNQALVPDENISVELSGSYFQVDIEPAEDQTGSTLITITVSDGTLTASETFTLDVNNWTDLDTYDYRENVFISPNPFHEQLNICLEIQRPSKTKIQIIDIMGQEIDEITTTTLSEGKYNFNWSPQDMANGIYFCRIQMNDVIILRKIILAR